MKEYFGLQLKMNSRKLIEFGLNPILGFCLMCVVFIGFSLYLFEKTEFAEYLFMLIALSFVSKLSEKKRNDFLKTIFLSKAYWKIRLIENAIVVLPFIIFLVFKQQFLSVIILAALTPIMGFVNFNSAYSYTIPTPFYKKPFEFAVGFRNTFYLFLFAYFLTFMAIAVDNFNLGAFAFLLVFLVSLTFFSKPENEYFVWVSSKTSKEFLFEKIKMAIVYTTILCLPIAIALGIFFLSDMGILLILALLGYAYLVAIIFAKYSAYPYEMSLPQVIFIGMSLLLPPVLIVVIPYFYLQSINRLNLILDDKN